MPDEYDFDVVQEGDVIRLTGNHDEHTEKVVEVKRDEFGTLAKFEGSNCYHNIELLSDIGYNIELVDWDD